MKKYFSVFFLFLVMPVFANSPIRVVTIKTLVIHDSNSQVYVTVEPAFTHNEGCQSNDVLVVLKSNPSFPQIYSALLASYHVNGKITGWVNGCDSQSGVSSPILTRLDLVK